LAQLRTVELFSGVGGFRIAADALGAKTVWANDIDPGACAVYRARFGPHAIVEGDIRKHLRDLPNHELLTGGFPCQPFSSAGKKRGIADPRGTLFQAVVDALELKRPRFFVLENVKRLLEMERGWHFATILDSLSRLDYRIEWRLLNGSHFGLAQNRQRVFLLGTRVDRDNGRKGGPFDEPVRLASRIDLSFLTPEQSARLSSPDRWLPFEMHDSTFPAWGICVDRRFFAADLPEFSERQPSVVLGDVMERVVDARFDFTESTLKWLHKNSPVNRFVDRVEILSNQAGGARMGYTVFGTAGVAPTLTATTSRHYERYKVGNRYRRLTNVEYARLQGFPDDHCKGASVYDQYRLFGNAVPPPMARWVIAQALGKGIRVHADNNQAIAGS
jgi:DNA (cytosine-5)-methyltransferase 1